MNCFVYYCWFFSSSPFPYSAASTYLRFLCIFLTQPRWIVSWAFFALRIRIKYTLANQLKWCCSVHLVHSNSKQIFAYPLFFLASFSFGLSYVIFATHCTFSVYVIHSYILIDRSMDIDSDNNRNQNNVFTNRPDCQLVIFCAHCSSSENMIKVKQKKT